MPNTPTPSSGALYKRLLGYAFEYKLLFILGIFGFALFSAMEASLVFTVEAFLNALQGKPTARLGFLADEITASLYFVPIAVLVLTVFRGIGSFVGEFFLARVGLLVVNNLRKSVYSHMIELPQPYFDRANSGELVSLITFNIQQVTQSVTNAVKTLIRDGLLVIFLFIILIYLNWLLTLVFVATAPILAGLIVLASRYFLKVSRKIQDAIGKVTHIATESIQGIKLVKSFRGEAYEVDRFKRAADENLRFQTKYERLKAIQTPVLHLIISIALAIIMLLVLLFWKTDPESAVTYIVTAGLIAKPFRQLTKINSIIQTGVAAAETIFSTIDLKPEANTGKTILDNVKGQIEFKHVSFGYTENDLALDDFNLSISPGETVALVGESGSGKSTLANLLLRFYETSAGEVIIDGHAIQDIELNSLRQNIALVNQQAILFSDSVNANIAYGEDLKNCSEDEIRAAAKRAYANHFINQLEGNYSQHVGESGDKLSGGQRQRITIARALLKNAPILILDEATSALDNESETKIQQAIDELKQGQTTIIIAHRLSTIINADKIAVLDKGRLVELGNHNDLIKQNGYYAALYNKSAKQDTNSLV